MKFIDNLFSFNLDTSHKFNLPNNNSNSNPKDKPKPETLTKSLTENLEIFGKLYSKEINSDICTRNLY